MGGRWSTTKIRRLFILLFFFLSIVPTVVVSAVTIISFEKRNSGLIRENMSSSASVQAETLRLFFEQQKDNLKILSKQQVIRRYLSSEEDGQTASRQVDFQLISDLLAARAENQSYLRRLMLIDRNDMVVASNELSAVGNRTLFSEDLKGIPQNSVLVTDILAIEGFHDNLRHFCIVTPIYEDNVYIGAVGMAIDLSYFDQVIGVGHSVSSGYLYLVDTEGGIAASGGGPLQYSLKESAGLPGTTFLAELEQAKATSEHDGFFQYQLGGTEKFAYFTTIGDTNWMLLSVVDWSEFTESTGRLIGLAVIFLIAGILIAAVASLIIVRGFSKPVAELLSTIRRINAGEYGVRFEHTGTGEIAEIAEAFNALIDMLVTNAQELTNHKQNLEAITRNIPGAVQQCACTDGYEFLFVSEGYRSLTGCSREDLETLYDNKFLNTIHPKDRTRIVKELERQLQFENSVEVQYRIAREDEEIIWVLLKGQLVGDRLGTQSLYCVLVDVTTTKKAQEALRQSEERYRIILQQTDNIICEWDFEKDEITFPSFWYKKFGYRPIHEHVSSALLGSRRIHPDDLPSFCQWVKKTYRGKHNTTSEFRIQKENGEYIWVMVRATAILDENGVPIRAIGVIGDIDKQKKELTRLTRKAQIDTLTGIYNKGTTETLISEYLAGEGSLQQNVLVIVDVDNFKQVNDLMGHLYGDDVLTNLGATLKSLFRSYDIAGRIGGDEFVVLLKDLYSTELLEEKLQRVCDTVRQTLTDGTHTCKISCSIGAAFYPANGKTYVELLRKADLALYHAKSLGKDRYALAEEEC